MQMLDRATLDESPRDVVVVVRSLFHEAGDDRHVAGLFGEALELLSVCAEADVVGELFEEVAGEGQLGKNDKVSALLLGLLDQVNVLLDVAC